MAIHNVCGFQDSRNETADGKTRTQDQRKIFTAGNSVGSGLAHHRQCYDEAEKTIFSKGLLSKRPTQTGSVRAPSRYNLHHLPTVLSWNLHVSRLQNRVLEHRRQRGSRPSTFQA
ncbi:hypothetical protein NDU88_005861 [Pleurodeles waltl]|uniref:Uncharacterized protein n=1 Tax=Pleurodeles waltl TaxID=8319 RepID=A0AAV7WD13_PLEWA|nr:hypothetical protein NDU88_005861 [Pleurodeles waltl]